MTNSHDVTTFISSDSRGSGSGMHSDVPRDATPFDDLMTLVQTALFEGEPKTAHDLARHDLALKLASVLSDLDDITAMAARPETVEMVNAERAMLGSINTRVQLILSFILARQPLTLQAIRGGRQ